MDGKRSHFQKRKFTIIACGPPDFSYEEVLTKMKTPEETQHFITYLIKDMVHISWVRTSYSVNGAFWKGS
jgi:hypothetical protein